MKKFNELPEKSCKTSNACVLTRSALSRRSVVSKPLEDYLSTYFPRDTVKQ